MKSVSRRLVEDELQGLRVIVGLGLGLCSASTGGQLAYDSRAASDEPRRSIGRLTRRPCARPKPSYVAVACFCCLIKLELLRWVRRDRSLQLASDCRRASSRGLRSQSTRRWLRHSGHAEVHCTTIAHVGNLNPSLKLTQTLASPTRWYA